jgi:hypothetical protein
VTVVATTRQPKRVLTPEQRAEMLRKEDIVLRERIKGKSFYQIEKDHRIHNPDRVWKRAVAREENAPFLRAEAVRLEELRLDALQEGIWPRALQGDPRAVEVALKVLERRARMGGLDFADMVSGQLVEVERAKVKVMAGALVAALQAAGATDDQRRAATAAFFAELRALHAADAPALPPREGDQDGEAEWLSEEDEALL